MTLAVRQPESEALETSLFGEGTDTPVPISTQALVTMMIKSGSGISDLIFSPGRPPQVEQHGELTPVTTPELSTLRAEDTCRVARDVVGRNLQAMRTLHEHVLDPRLRAVPGQRLPAAGKLRDRDAGDCVQDSERRRAEASSGPV